MLAALRYRDYRIYWVGITAQNLGLWTYRFVFGWLVVQLAVSDGTPHLAPLYLGLVGFVSAIPSLGLTLFAGAIADRTNVVRMMILSEVAIATLALVLGIITVIGAASIGVVLIVATLMSAAFSFESPARVSVLMRLMPVDDAMSGMGLYSVSFNGAQILGPALGGLLIGPLGVSGLFFIGAVGYYCLAGSLLLVRVRPLPPSPPAKGTILGGVAEGLRYVRGNPTILWVLALAAVFSFLARPYANLLPAFVEGILHGGATDLSLILALSGVGGFLGALLLSNLPMRRSGLIFIGTLAASGGAICALALQRDVAGAAALGFVAGFLTLLCNGVQNVILQVKADPRMMGRVVSISSVIFFAVIPLGQTALGALGSVFGIDQTIFAGGAVTVVIALAALALATPLRDIAATASAAKVEEAVVAQSAN